MLWLQAGPGCGLVHGLRRQACWHRPVCTALPSATPAMLALAVSWRLRQHLPLMCACAWRWLATAPALAADTKQPCCINKPTVAQHSVPTDCTFTVMQQEIKLLCPGPIAAQLGNFGPNLAFVVTTITYYFLFFLIITNYYLLSW